MKQLYELSPEERKLYFEQAAYESEKSFEVIEKDYWVVWTLDRLFSVPELKDHLTFKGGTSLSKIYGIIDRFSEDVDVSIERQFLGFGDEKAPEKQQTRKKQTAILEEMAQACAKYIQGDLLKTLGSLIEKKLGGKDGWSLIVDPEEDQTLLFYYPAISKNESYIRQFVKIEMGTRTDHWPVTVHPIQSYAKFALKDKIDEPEVHVRVLNAERTFWEKATILHQYAHLPETKALPARLSRHLYDFYKLLNSPTRAEALKQIDLLERVANHKKVYFSSTWANYDVARKGTLRLSPPPRVREELEKDYKLMEPMFFGEIPKWSLILQNIADFEKEFNS